MFAEETLFAYARENLADEIAGYLAPEPTPLQCDRWIARSALQKGCRRGEVEIALQALANLFAADPRAIWRHMVVIALEDIGVAGTDVLANVVAAARDRKWRSRLGGDWRVASFLTTQLCRSMHCQAVCDLLLRALNDPSLDVPRMQMLDADLSDLAAILRESTRPMEQKGLAALAMGGGLAEGQRHHDACAVFDLLEEGSCSPHVVATCRAAWRISRSEMSLLLPMVWASWAACSHNGRAADDPMPPVQMLGGVPGYVLDQFTRVGNAVFRALLKEDAGLRALLTAGAIESARQPRAVGDILFLAEGGLLRQRLLWAVGDGLRLPYRPLPAATSLSNHVTAAVAHLLSKGGHIATLRSQYFQTASM